MIDDGFGHWLAGFIDGEGCFFIARQRRVGYYTYQPSFQLNVRLDDREIVEEIHSRTGLGWTRLLKERAGGNTKPQIGWGVTSKADCLALVELLDRYPLRAKKSRDYAIWRSAVLASAATRYRGASGPADWSDLEHFADELKTTRLYAVA